MNTTPASARKSRLKAAAVRAENGRAEALLRTGALQRAIFNSANFSSIATDAKGVIQIFNVGAERMLGYAAGDVMNKVTVVALHEPQELIARAAALSLEFGMPIAPGFEALVFKASRGIEDIYEVTKVRKDGSRFPAVVSVTALRDPQEAIIGYLLIGTDNTARKQVEDERTKLDQRLRDQQFYTRSLIESNIDALMTTDPRGIITDVNKQTEALTGCTRDELIGAPFKNYFTDPERAEAGIKRVLGEGKVKDRVRTAAKAPGAPRLEPGAGAPVALVVEDDLKSSELIRLQLEAEGFTVLQASSAEAALALAMDQPVSLITLDIMLPHIDGWEFLSRLKRVPALARIPVVIISFLADRNKGFALGASAILQKPISRQELYDALVELGLFPLSGRTLKVLVVDDDPSSVELIAVRMLGLASTVLRAYGGREAIETAQRERPDLIVLDLMMPEVNGFEVVEALNGHPDTAHIPILVVTAKAISAGDREKLAGAVTAIMEKAGFDRDRFTAEVRRAMSGRKAVA